MPRMLNNKDMQTTMGIVPSRSDLHSRVTSPRTALRGTSLPIT